MSDSEEVAISFECQSPCNEGASLLHVLHDLLKGLVLGQVKVLDDLFVRFPCWFCGFPCGQHRGLFGAIGGVQSRDRSRRVHIRSNAPPAALISPPSSRAGKFGNE
jgi:hypothetical protein